MVRKNLLKGLLAEPAPVATSPAPTERPRAGSGNGGAHRRGEPRHRRPQGPCRPGARRHLIDAGGVTDRLEHDEADHARLVASLRAWGQQVPILVRLHPRRRASTRSSTAATGSSPSATSASRCGRWCVISTTSPSSWPRVRRVPPGATSASSTRPTSPASSSRPATNTPWPATPFRSTRPCLAGCSPSPAVFPSPSSRCHPGIGRDRLARLRRPPRRPVPRPRPSPRHSRRLHAPARPRQPFQALDAWLASLHASDGRPLAELTPRHPDSHLAERLDGFEDWLVSHLADIHAT